MKSASKTKKIDPVERLPSELMCRIFSYLTPADLSRVAQVNRSWQTMADDDFLWAALVDSSKEKLDEHLKEIGSYKQLFIKYLQYRQNEYLATDKPGRKLCQTQAEQHFEAIKQFNRWRIWLTNYQNAYNALCKDHPLIKQVLDVVCRARFCMKSGNSSIKVASDPNDYVKAFNYLYKQKVLNKKTLMCIAACVNDNRFLEKIDVEHYVYFIVTFYRANILSKDNLDAVKESSNPHMRLSEAFSIILDAMKYDTQTKKQENFEKCRDRLLDLGRTCDAPYLRTYAKCMFNLHTNNILLSCHNHAVIYDELLKFKSETARSFSVSYVILHKAGLLLAPGCKLLRDILLSNPRDDGDWRAEEIILNYICGTLRPYVEQELEELDIDPDIVALVALENLPIDLDTVRKAVKELYELGIDLDTVREKLEEFPNNYCEFDDNDSGRGSGDNESVGSPASSFLSKPHVVENTPSPTVTQTQSDNEPLTQDEAQFKNLSSKLVSPDNTTCILQALHAHDAQSFETAQGFLLNQCISREFLLKKNGAAAIADLNGNKQLALFIRIAAELDKQLYENDRSLIKRLPDDDRTQAAEDYLRQQYRPAVFSAIKDYLQKASPSKGDQEILSKALEEATERFFHNKSPSKEGNPPVKSLAEDRTRLSQLGREIAMVVVNLALILTLVGIPLIVYHYRKYGSTLFGATQSKQRLNHMKKKVLHDITEFSSKYEFNDMDSPTLKPASKSQNGTLTISI